MTTMKPCWGVLFSALLAIGAAPGANAAPKEGTQQVLTTRNTYAAGSADVRRIQAWLLSHATYSNGSMIGEPGKLGTVTIIYTASIARDGSWRTFGPGDGGPPVALPMSGNNGDTITIQSCSHGVGQSWTYVWNGSPTEGSWTLIEYHYNAKSCSTGG